MRFRLRTLLIVLALGPMVAWVAWLGYWALATEVTRAMLRAKIQPVNSLDDGSWNPSYPPTGDEAP